ncbi:hypothetical protein AAFF_G00161090 [Aldrovandia affinis]|uniref:Uncharacterized protein n=1 Tax=Aldrovandia affinis TaxID=143900 RepID=A0AAD7RN03_9TELE|nr:hypothetical protein AAFF_G00161090 [Aldrovandia affinis]
MSCDVGDPDAEASGRFQDGSQTLRSPDRRLTPAEHRWTYWSNSDSGQHGGPRERRHVDGDGTFAPRGDTLYRCGRVVLGRGQAPGIRAIRILSLVNAAQPLTPPAPVALGTCRGATRSVTDTALWLWREKEGTRVSSRWSWDCCPLKSHASPELTPAGTRVSLDQHSLLLPSAAAEAGIATATAIAMVTAAGRMLQGYIQWIV